MRSDRERPALAAIAPFGFLLKNKGHKDFIGVTF